MTDKDLIKHIEEVCRSLIYHGRNFSVKRDDIVITKSIHRIADIIEEWLHEPTSEI